MIYYEYMGKQCRIFKEGEMISHFENDPADPMNPICIAGPMEGDIVIVDIKDRVTIWHNGAWIGIAMLLGDRAHIEAIMSGKITDGNDKLIASAIQYPDSDEHTTEKLQVWEQVLQQVKV